MRARAQPGPDGEPIVLEWRAPTGCPSADDVKAETLRLLGGAPTASGKRVIARAEVRALESGMFRLEVRTESRGAAGQRRLEADACQTLADAAALIIALALDAEAVACAQHRPGAGTGVPEEVPGPSSAPVSPGPARAPVHDGTTVSGTNEAHEQPHTRTDAPPPSRPPVLPTPSGPPSHRRRRTRRPAELFGHRPYLAEHRIFTRLAGIAHHMVDQLVGVIEQVPEDVAKHLAAVLAKNGGRSGGLPRWRLLVRLLGEHALAILSSPAFPRTGTMTTPATAQRQRVVVTGGAGFVGRHLVNALADRGHDVVSIDIREERWRDDVAFVGADIRDAKPVAEACAGAAVVFHAASIVHTKKNREADVWSVNLGGTDVVLSACHEANVPRLIYVSSASAVYEGRDIEHGDESLPYASISQAPYADSKIAAEKKVLAANGNSLMTCALRPHVVFGPGDNRFLPAILNRARAGKLNYAVGSGDKLSDFTYIANLVDALLLTEEKLAPQSPVAGQAYFITNGEPYPFFQFVADLLAELDLPPIKGSVPYPIAFAVAAMAEAWDTWKGGTLNAENGFTRFAVRYMCTHHYFSIAKARRDLGFEPRVPLAEGIRRTAEHIKASPWRF